MARMIVATLVLLVTGIGYAALVTSTVFHVETEIPAPPEAVRAVLTDTARYDEWNPTQVEVRGEHHLGALVTAVFAQPGGEPLEVEMTVLELDAPNLLRQGGGTPGVITFDHSWILERTAAGTRVIQNEVDRGLFLWFWDSSWIEPAYQRASDALGNRVVALQAAP